MEVWGAQGSANFEGKGGKGGYYSGNYNGNGLLYVCVGGQAGYNGGGLSPSHGQNGGGATHIATTNKGVLSSYINNQSEVLIVAGGGGAANDNGVGGTGGGTSGGAGTQITYTNNTIITGGTGGTQTSGGTFSGTAYSSNSRVIVNGSFGQGGYSYAAANGVSNDTGGCGGGGWYGGAGTPVSGTGGGGSGHINANKITNSSTTSGVREGNGYALITWMPVL